MIIQHNREFPHSLQIASLKYLCVGMITLFYCTNGEGESFLPSFNYSIKQPLNLNFSRMLILRDRSFDRDIKIAKWNLGSIYIMWSCKTSAKYESDAQVNGSTAILTQ